jgi:hypothetical protein
VRFVRHRKACVRLSPAGGLIDEAAPNQPPFDDSRVRGFTREIAMPADPFAQFQAANMALMMALCRALIDSRAVDPAILITHLENLSTAASASELSPGAQAVVIDQFLKEVKAYVSRQEGAPPEIN